MFRGSRTGGGRAGAGQARPDDGAVRGEAVEEGAELALDAPVRAVGEHEAGAGAADGARQHGFGKGDRSRGHFPAAASWPPVLPSGR
jgi:hypothetical protein